ncbi:MAG: protein of unknown function (DUF1851) [Verrucomicrobia bacterium]|jgi:hypothetical protein|nr:MAG: protein of unknown function (DUF1851) [Verrucomicrobiota bacterium]
MSLAHFKSAYTATAGVAEALPHGSDFGVPGLGAVFSELGGRTYNHGLYRVLHSKQVAAAIQAMESVFPEYRDRIVPFGFDWLGRHFASDLKRVENGQPLVLMLEVGAGEAMEIPASVTDFHNTELVDYADDALAAPFWRQWRSLHPADLAFADCVGYKVPLFLGGADAVDNLEVIDLEVYVEICGQLRRKARNLAPGQSIRNVAFTD